MSYGRRISRKDTPNTANIKIYDEPAYVSFVSTSQTIGSTAIDSSPDGSIGLHGYTHGFPCTNS
jgi:hypothetical protein